MSDIRKELLRQMQAIRERMDPKLLERAKLSVFGKVPYDRDAAKEAVGRFLDSRNDSGAFRRKLEAELRKEGASLDLDTGDGKTATGDTAPDHPLKPRRIGRIT